MTTLFTMQPSFVKSLSRKYTKARTSSLSGDRMLIVERHLLSKRRLAPRLVRYVPRRRSDRVGHFPQSRPELRSFGPTLLIRAQEDIIELQTQYSPAAILPNIFIFVHSNSEDSTAAWRGIVQIHQSVPSR